MSRRRICFLAPGTVDSECYGYTSEMPIELWVPPVGTVITKLSMLDPWLSLTIAVFKLIQYTRPYLSMSCCINLGKLSKTPSTGQMIHITIPIRNFFQCHIFVKLHLDKIFVKFKLAKVDASRKSWPSNFTMSPLTPLVLSFRSLTRSRARDSSKNQKFVIVNSAVLICHFKL